MGPVKKTRPPHSGYTQHGLAQTTVVVVSEKVNNLCDAFSKKMMKSQVALPCETLQSNVLIPMAISSVLEANAARTDMN
jgi:hypothetical protein